MRNLEFLVTDLCKNSTQFNNLAEDTIDNNATIQYKIINLQSLITIAPLLRKFHRIRALLILILLENLLKSSTKTLF